MASPTSASGSQPHQQFLRVDQAEQGTLHSAEKLVTLLNAEEWELLVRDWAEVLKSKYHTVERIGGSGDQGRDVLAYLADPKASPPWDNFQCKFYKDPLTPTQIWVEIGKLCWYTFQDEFSVPREYRFVSPKDVGTKLFKLLERPDRVKQGLKSEWDDHCRNSITKKHPIKLEGKFRDYVEAFDFSIFGYYPVRKLLGELKGTPAFIKRFGGGLPDRPPASVPPTAIGPEETKYVRRLLDAYAHCLNCTIASPDALQDGLHRRHFNRSREDFYRAESLRVFSRSTVPDGTFDALQHEVYSGVIDICDSTHADGFECVKATVKAARELQLTSNALISVITPADRSGICHQLSSADKLIWVKNDNS